MMKRNKMSTATKSKSKKTKKRKRATVNYQLVEVVPDGENVVFVPLPVPEGTDTSKGRTPIMRAVKAAVRAGDTTYDDKDITVVSYANPVTVQTEKVVVKRKVTFAPTKS